MIKKNNTKTIKIVILGIGGGATFYIARFFNFLGAEVIGFDINKNDRTEQLQKEGIKINYKNPKEPFDRDTDLIIYSDSLPDNLIEKVKFDNLEVISKPYKPKQRDSHSLITNLGMTGSKSRMIEVGEFTNWLITKYERDQLEGKGKTSFEEAKIAPLFKLDTSNTKLIGITGTDGKTTTASMLWSILKQKNKTGLITTVGARVGDEEIDTGTHTTTPSNQELFKILTKMIEKKCKYVVLEVSSHALSMGRVAGLNFDVAIITNVTKEHLNYHKTFKEYIKAKSLLFSNHLKKEGKAILNFDDKKSYDYLKNLGENNILYSISPTKGFFKEKDTTIYAENIKKIDWGSNFEIKVENRKRENHFILNLPIPGEYNISNSLAAIGAAVALKVGKKEIKKGLESSEPPKGRMEILQEEPFKVIVDYAHTPNGLENLLKTLQKSKQKKNNKLIAVIGAEGKRDPSKRGAMGKIAGKYSDITILTAVDSRTESLEEINNEIEEGWLNQTKISEKNKKKTEWGSVTKGKSNKILIRYDDESLKEHIRRKAIARALREAHHKDIVIIAGKGHEDSICFGTTDYEWNDLEEVKKLLKL